MGRVIAIDYGKKRTGIAVSDPLQMIAGGLATVAAHEIIPFLKKYTEENEVELILLGEPRQMNYLYSENMDRVRQFHNLLHKSIPDIEIRYVDERFTSVLAHRAMLEGGLKRQKRRDKALVDEISATIILQSWLESRNIKRVTN
ncbi:MAG: Holliday junction resolvase RuvX [Dysgonamonadaceae bacterium]|nr:Holliday junction resolvase RuvX [Dysgonamonadaceae bacterium]